MTTSPERPYPIIFRRVGTTTPLRATREGYSSEPEFVAVEVQHHRDNTIDLVPTYGNPGRGMVGTVRMSVEEFKKAGSANMDEQTKAKWALELCGWTIAVK